MTICAPALVCSQTSDTCIETGLGLVGDLLRFWATRGHFREGRRWAKTLAVAPPASPPTRGAYQGARARPAIWPICKATTKKHVPAVKRHCRAHKRSGDKPLPLRHPPAGWGSWRTCPGRLRGRVPLLPGEPGAQPRIGRPLGRGHGCLANLGLAAWHHDDASAARAYLESASICAAHWATRSASPTSSTYWPTWPGRRAGGPKRSP